MRFLLLLLTLALSSCHSPISILQTDVLVLGGGTGGTAAAIQSARSGAQTILVEPSPWLGGMLTAAGVSATDGNHNMPAGIWGEFRDSLRARYGGAEALSTGWVSNTQFEPHVGAAVFANMAGAEPKLETWLEGSWENIQREEGRWAVEVKRGGKTYRVLARILVDGTDLGDVAAAAGAAYDSGMDARSLTGEAMAPEKENEIVQDLTWCAVLKDYGQGADKTIPKPENYDPSVFYCSCKKLCRDSSVRTHPCETMLSYAKLPGNKYMINWPIYGNDYYANVIELPETERQKVYAEAKAHTLAFVYFIQHELGYRHLGLADDEFPSPDKLPLVPYHREGRRIRGLVQLNINHLTSPFDQAHPLYRTGIAVGDYPVDHHHGKNPEAPEIDFPPVPSFNIPLGCLIPANTPDLIVADKPVSVTNIVNGSTRLQPVVLQIGQVAGLLAAMAAKNGVPPSKVPVRAVQRELLNAKGYLMPYYDVPPTHPAFPAIQRVGASGILKGLGEPFQWANRTWFYPDTVILNTELVAGLQEMSPDFYSNVRMDAAPLTFESAWLIVADFLEFTPWIDRPDLPETPDSFHRWLKSRPEFANVRPQDPISKGQLAQLLDLLFNPFGTEVDHKGNWLVPK